MKAVFVVALLVGVVAAATVEQQFQEFMHTYGKRYQGAEYAKKLAIFERNLRIAAQFQREERGSAVHGVTQFFDMTYEEWAASYLMPPMPGASLCRNCLKNGVYNPPQKVKDPVPASFDWRDHPGVVNPVRDQASCGSCWAFSAAQTLEGVYALNTGGNVTLSPQYIVDCSKGCSSEIYLGSNTTVCNQGCNGGWPWTAFQDIIDQGGLPSEADYPYRGVDQTCKGNNNDKIVVKMHNYTCVSGPNAADEKDMQQALMTYGPLSIALDANNFYSYSKGIMDPASCPTTYLNHAILLVGWGTENGKDYWIIKNSWGASWGEAGYVRLARGKGTCGVNEGVTAANY